MRTWNTIHLEDFKFRIFVDPKETYICIEIDNFLGLKSSQFGIYMNSGHFNFQTADCNFCKVSVLTWLDTILKTVKKCIL